MRSGDEIAILSVICVMALAGCGRSTNKASDEVQILCSLKAEAYEHKIGAIDVSFVTRMPEADVLCSALKAKS